MKTKALLLALTLALPASLAKAADDFDHRFDRKETCSGVVTINGTTPESFKDDGSRLIRETDITASCLFSTGTKIGRRIMRTCRMGFGCMVRATVNSDSSDVNYILKVHAVKLVR